jgi:hypothetical protein
MAIDKLKKQTLRACFEIFTLALYLPFLPHRAPETRYIEPLCASFQAPDGTKMIKKQLR